MTSPKLRDAGEATISTTGAAEPLERAAELQQLSALLAAAGSGRGQVGVIEGPSGVGKSRLLDECAASAEALGMSVLRSRGNELTRDHPFGIARNLFEARLIHAAAETRARLMRGPAALAEPIFGNGEAADDLGILRGLYWLSVNLAEQRPIAILIDDLPWADDFSLRFIAYLAERLGDVPVALVVTIRSGDPGAESQLIGHVWDAVTSPPIRPAALTVGAVETLLADTLPSHDVDASVARAVVAETGGNPFLVVAVADSIRAGEDPELTTPESVRRRIARRLARLSPAARDLAKAVSVLGGDAALRDGIQLAGLKPEYGVAAAEELVDAQFLGSADPSMCAHRLVRTTIYKLLEPGERLALHAGAAKLLAHNRAEPEVVAEHLLMSGTTHDAWALGVLHEAGRAAGRRGAAAAALRYLRHAVEAGNGNDLHPRVLIDLGLAEAASGESISLGRFEQALDLVSEPKEGADALYSLGQTLYHFGRYDEAAAAFHRGAQLFDGGDVQAQRRFEGAAWSAESHLRPAQRGPEHAIDGNGPGDRAILAVQALRDSLTAPPVDRAADLAIRALGDGALLAEQGSQGPSVNLATMALLHSGRLVQAHDAADATIRDATDRGAQLAYAEASLVRAFVLYARGRVIDAAADAQATIDLLQPTGHAHGQIARAALVHCMIERGELEEAASIFEPADEQLTPTPVIHAYVSLARARLHLRRRDVDAARKDLDSAENTLRDLGATNPTMVPWRSLAGVVAHLSGDEVRSHSLIEEEIHLARSFEVPIALGIALHRRARTEVGNQALESFREAISALENTEARLEIARAHAGLGRGLRRAGQRIDARGHLGVGLDLAHRCGATGLEAEIREELLAAGGRPRRPTISGAKSLTPTELRVAHLAAEGLSNPEIAERAFVSRHTIAWHLSNVYRKLQIESREQLPLHIDT